MQTLDMESWQAWHHAAAQPRVDEALRALYAELDAAVAARGPTCWQSGRCCNFTTFGHRLYVTALEIAWFRQHIAPPPNPVARSGIALPLATQHETADADLCPYQIDRLCTAHAVRPLGCRIFFCQQGTEAWQQDLYEQFLQQLQRLHEDHGIAYRYLDWMAGLSEASAAARPAGR